MLLSFDDKSKLLVYPWSRLILPKTWDGGVRVVMSLC